MNSKIIFLAGIAIITTFASFAQDTSGIKSLQPVVVRSTTKKIPGRIWKSFSHYFNDAENPRWYTVNKNYLVKYMIYDEENRALFTKRGSLVYHISYGYEKTLTEDLKRQIKHDYYDYTITRAIKVAQAGRIIWVVNLEDSENLVLLSLEDGEMEEVERLKKSL
jgi:hypothetical protein